MNCIEVKKLIQKNGRVECLHNITFSVPKNAICAFVGPNGAGKTTTIKCLLNLYPKYKGEILLNNKVNTVAINKNEIGYVPEKENFPKRKTFDFLKFMCRLTKISKVESVNLINRFLKDINAENLKNLYLNKMSSGQKKKIMIIQAFLHNPDLIIMDEPTENMDPDTRMLFYKMVKNLHKNNKTIFISTHQLEEIKDIANYVVIIKDGNIRYCGSFDKNKNKLMNLYKNS
jgi:ABC-2 type transport system ATP-binding protein